MGRSSTPRYRVEYYCLGNVRMSNACWDVKSKYGNIPGKGKPTTENLAKHVEGFVNSTKSGGCNSHIGDQDSVVAGARIVDQFTGDVKATYWRNGWNDDNFFTGKSSCF